MTDGDSDVGSKWTLVRALVRVTVRELVNVWRRGRSGGRLGDA